MKKLQNNFTTPDQSKRLLELGLPEDSADCYYHHYFTDDPTPLLRVLQLQWDETIGAIRGKSGQKIEPCWSVGRLIEILSKCMPSEIYTPKFCTDDNILDTVLGDIERELDYGLTFQNWRNDYDLRTN